MKFDCIRFRVIDISYLSIDRIFHQLACQTQTRIYCTKYKVIGINTTIALPSITTLTPITNTLIMNGIISLLLSLLIAIIGVDLSSASNFNKPHSHTGKVEQFQPGDPKIKLDGSAKSILKKGKPYQVRRYVVYPYCVCICWE